MRGNRITAMSLSICRSLSLQPVLPLAPLWLYRQRRGKRKLIDFACRRLQIRSLADLGGAWGVNGEYTFYAMKTHKIENASLIDLAITKSVAEKQIEYPGLGLITGNFGDNEVAHQVGNVDAVILFDVLLHQIRPNWDEILELYATQTRDRKSTRLNSSHSRASRMPSSA